MAFVVGVGEDLFELRVSPGAAAVFGWAGPLGGDQDGVVELGVGVEQILDEDLVFPVVAEVVCVAEPVADADEASAPGLTGE